MGARGFARVVAIEPCPPLEQGAGRLVTGTFCHTSGEVYDLKLASESKPIGVTASHPFWSLDRNAWVSAINLEIGETLKTLAGTTVVESRSKREEREAVYNIEVEGDHVYRVGESGILAHNASFCPNEDEQRASEFIGIGEYCRDPDFQERYPYESAKQACVAAGGRPGNIGPMNDVPNDCNNDGGSRHARCFPGDLPSAISCRCITESGSVGERWKLAE